MQEEGVVWPPFSPTGGRRRLVFAACLPALFAIWLHAPAWNGGLLADELLLLGYVTTDDGVHVDWQRVLDDFHGPWAFGYGSYYRPLVTLSLALDHWLGGGDAYMLHCTSIALFALCVYSVAHLFGLLFGARAALFGGLLFAAHPGAHEPICWPCTRADFMVLIASAWACHHFVQHLRTGRARSLLATAVAALIALACKELGLLLAAWFVLLEIGVRERDVPLRERLRPHLLLVPIWFGYLVLRGHALGIDLVDAAAAPHVDLATSWTDVKRTQLRACFAPNGSLLPASCPYTLGALTGLVAVAGLGWRAHRRWLGIGVAWMAVASLPVQWLPVTPDFGNGRIVIGPMVGFALVMAAVAGSRRTPRWLLGAIAVALVFAVVDMATATRSIQQRYHHAWRHMDTLRGQFDAAGRMATVAAPLVLTAGVPATADVPFLGPTMAFALTEPPLCDRSHPFVSLGFSQEPRVGRDLLQGEVTPWRQMWQQGALLCYWSDAYTNGDLVLVAGQRGGDGDAEALALVREGPLFVVPGGRVEPWVVGAVEIVSAEPFAAGVLEWHSMHGPAGRRAFAAASATNEGFGSVVDFDDDREFLVHGTLAGIRGFAIAAPGPSPTQTLRVRPPPHPAPLAFLLQDAPVALATIREHLPMASLPADADVGSRAVVMMNKACAFRLSLEPGADPHLPAAVRSLLAEVDRFSPRDRVYYYLECRRQGRAWRSAVDWFIRAQPSR